MLYVDPNGEEVWRKHIEGESRKKEERLITAQMLGDGTYILAGTSAKELGKENWKIVKLGEQLRKPVLATCDVHFLNPEDEIYRRIIMAGKGFKDAVKAGVPTV